MIRTGIVARYRLRCGAHFNNNLIEAGFGSPASATSASIVNGAVWRKDGTGQWVPVISLANSEVLGTPISNATFVAAVAATDYAMFEVEIFDTYVKFSIYTQAGALAFEQIVNWGATTQGFSQTALQALLRTYNSGATGTAVQMFLGDASVTAIDMAATRPWSALMSGMGESVLVSPTTYAQFANYANSAAPANAALSNTAAGYANLGGQFQFAAVAGAETDYALFAVQIPSPKHFIFRGIRISTYNLVAAVATTATVLQWGIGFNSSAVSLATGAPYPYMRQAIGTQNFQVGAGIGAQANDVVWQPQSEIVVMPGRFLSVILKMPLATATATEIFRGTVSLDGYFE
jgi:hypothetical protein